MQNKKTIVILQDCDENLKSCCDALKDDFKILAATDDGEQGAAAIDKFQPDFLVTTLVLKKLDGFGVLAFTKENSPKTKSIVISEFSGGDMIKQSIDSGASYFMLTPIDYELLIRRLKLLADFDNSSAIDVKNRRAPRAGALDEKISRIFIGMGIPPHIKGYCYLREGVKLAVGDPDLINSVTKKLYPMIGDIYGTTASKVERAIRHAIEVAWNKGRIEAFNSLFGVRAYSESEKPTNSEFIALIADRMLLDGVS